ncbi:hypothetical protein [Enterococcus thailandicus]|uniref:hypothetical protein n=1 Tax=Enterococcus TaxID=1350 RepID=UPI0022E8F4A2|nr:hypothetical protein [Enterococcus thailandicus]
MDLSENTLNILNILLTALIAIISGFITSKYTTRPEKQKTSRLIFEKCYTQIYSLVEYDLYSKKLTLDKVRKYGYQIIEICEQSNNYFYPSVKIYAERLINSDSDNYQEQWNYFSTRFSLRYDTVCKDIGLPLRNHAYRVNRKQYENNWDLIRLILLNQWSDTLFLVLLLLIFTLYKINS